MRRDAARTSGYLRRMLGAVALTLVAILLVVLLGPRGNPEGQWYQHTGMAGPVEIVDNIQVIPDAPTDEISQQEMKQLAATTEGVDPVLTDKVLADNPDPLPLEQDRGNHAPNDTQIDRKGDANSRRDDPHSQVRRSRAVQQSLDFVLLESVNPDYPKTASAALRQREIVVSVAMYVDETGHVSDAYIRGNNGGPQFADAVLDAVRKWVYKPLLVDGKPSGFWDQINFVFTTPSRRPNAADAQLRSG